jgi:hypothetical protein
VSLVVIDLIPALLSWEGRDRSQELTLAPDGVEAVSHLYSHYRLLGITDAGIPSATLRAPLDDARIGDLFESIATSAGFGPIINARVLRRITTIERRAHGVVFVTGRTGLARSVNRSRISVVQTSRESFGGVPEAVATLLAGRVSP